MFSNIAEKIIVACIKLRSSSRDCSQLSAMWSMWCGGAVGGQQSGEQTQQRRPWRHASHVQFVVKDSGHCNEDKVAPTYVIHCDTGRRRSCVGVSPGRGAPLVSSDTTLQSAAELSVDTRWPASHCPLQWPVTTTAALQHCSSCPTCWGPWLASALRSDWPPSQPRSARPTTPSGWPRMTPG